MELQKGYSVNHFKKLTYIEKEANSTGNIQNAEWHCVEESKS